jgi:hypothetical protein
MRRFYAWAFLSTPRIITRWLGPEFRFNPAPRTETTQRIRETEAAAVAFVVCEAIGLKA